MFAFIILDSVSKMETSAIMPILFGLIGASLAWMWCSQNERGINYRNIGLGALLGAIAGALLVSQTENQDGIDTKYGRLTNRDLLEMKQKRDMANQFVVSAFRERSEEVHPMMANYYLSQYRFGDTSNRSVVTKMLLEKEADRLGIAISDDFITDYIKTVSEKKMTRDALTKIRSQLDMGESELYDTLRSELRARVASRVLNPELVHMPDQYWGDFEKLNVRHSIDAVAVPVEPFAARLAQPSDKEINELFETFKGVYPMGENPGFVQPDRLKLAWFESDYESAEALVGEIPEDELKARYEERKETEYKIETLPDLGAGFDDGAPKFGEPPTPVKSTTPETEGDAPGEAAKSDEPEAAPAAKTGDDAPTETPAGDDEPPAEDATSTDKKPDAASATEPGAEECGDGDEQDQKADAETDEANARKDEQPETPEKTPVADSKTDAGTKPAAEEPPAEPVDSPKDASEEPADVDLGGVKYRSFEEVRDEIRDLMLREKTEKQIEKQISAAISVVKDWRFKLRELKPENVKKATDFPTNEEYQEYLDELKPENVKKATDFPTDEEYQEYLDEPKPVDVKNATDFSTDVEYQEYLDEVKKELDSHIAARIAAKAKVYAEENGLKFVATEFLSQQELIEHTEFRLGNAREPSDPTDFMAQPQTAAARLFTGATTLFIPEEAQGQFDDTRYAFWATGENEQHVPTIDEPGVREQVEQAKRIQKARSEVEERATRLAESLQAKLSASSIVSIAEGVADQTVFGAKVPVTKETNEEDSSDSEPAEDDGEAPDESEKEDSCEDEEGTDAVAGETETKESAPAADEEGSDEATSTGTIDEPLSVISSPPFTWYQQSSQGMQGNPFGQPSLQFGFVPGIEGVDNNFMETVSKTAIGDVVVIPNLSKQIYYVVHVKARNPSGNDDPGLEPVRQQFIDENVPTSQIYGQLANSQNSEIYQAWQADFFAKHDVSVEELDAL
jgi:hypothetical protein